MRKVIRIENIEIGGNNPPLVIPEIGINHNGNLAIAKQMVDAAKRAGARIIKHQTHIVYDEMSQAARKVIPGNSNDSIYDIIKKCALSEKEEYELMQYVKSRGMVFLSTPFSRAAADRLNSFGVSAFKIGSGELNNYPLLRYIASFGKPMIVSTGMNDIKSIKKAVDIFEANGIDYSLLHATNLYPTSPHLVRLGAMQEMMQIFPNIPVGLSDHTTSNAACIASIALGASIVERHFVDVKSRVGPDVICSMDEKELAELIQAANDVPQMLGGEKKPAKEEQVTIDFAFATLVTVKPMKKGECFTRDNLWVKRPGKNGILAEHYDNILGRYASCDIENDMQITWDMVKN